MQKIRCSLFLSLMLLTVSAVAHAQTQSTDKTTQDSGIEDKKDSFSPLGIINNVFQAQKEKYQKELQDQIQNKLNYVEDKFNAVKSLTGKAEPEKTLQKDVTPATGEATKEPAEKPSPQAAGHSSERTDLWGKLNTLYEVTMAFLKQLMAILFK